MSVSGTSPNPLENTSSESAPPVAHRARHNWTVTPPGHLSIYVVQFTAGSDVADVDCCDRSTHWAIFVPTSASPGVGRFYETLYGSTRGHYRRFIVDEPHPMWRHRKATYLVGWVHPDHVDTLKTYFASATVRNCEEWVDDALSFLDGPHMYAMETACFRLRLQREEDAAMERMVALETSNRMQRRAYEGVYGVQEVDELTWDM